MNYQAKPSRYDSMNYRRCGNSGVMLPEISLGLWHNFGEVDDFRKSRDMLLLAFDEGITQYDLANNYGPPPGSAEEVFGKVLQTDLQSHRDEMIITSKAGYRIWPGPYGEWGSRKSLVASCDQSLRRMGVDYLDIFYSHRPDPQTPMEETMAALDYIVRSGRALYAGISSYNPEESRKAFELLQELGTPCLIHQPRYSMFDRWIEDGLLDVLEEFGVGAAVFSPLAQGLLTDKYLKGIPEDSRAAKSTGYLQVDDVHEERIHQAQRLNEVAGARDQKLSQMALTWALRQSMVSTVIIGASRPEHIYDAVAISRQPPLSPEELEIIELVLNP